MIRRRLRRREGQGLVEFSMIVPTFLLVLLGMLEFGFLFDQAMTINYATREGARSGAAFAAGNSNMPAGQVDDNVMAAVQRVLDSPGSRVRKANVTGVRIYQATGTGSDPGTAAAGRSWAYAAGGGPVVSAGEPPLDFRYISGSWAAAGRDNTWTNGVAPDSIGVSITYSYELVTPLSAIMGFFGPGGGPATITISDRTVMALNPTNQ